MHVLFVSGELITGDLCYRLQEEGCEVKLFVQHKEQSDCLNGFVSRTDDWKQELSWVGKDGLIVFDDVGYGREQDALRRDGYRVVGGSAGGDRLEQDRSYGQKILAECGMQTVPNFNFSTPKEAIQHIRENPRAWVVKQNTHQSALNYVGVLESGEDAISVLENYARKGITKLTLQEKIQGIEVSIGRYFNGHDWVGPSEITIEHKSLFNDNIGPKTGEMGNLMWRDDGRGKLFDETLAKIKKHLQAIGYRGDIDINSFVTQDAVFPIEITARFGCPIIHSQSVMFLSPWHEFLSAVADGKEYDLKHQDGYCIALTMALPPFPYEGSIAPEYSSDGFEIFFHEKLTPEERKNIHFEGVRREFVSGQERFFVSKSIGYTLFVTGMGQSIEDARRATYGLAKKIIIPKVFYRTDIGLEFANVHQSKLQSWGWI